MGMSKCDRCLRIINAVVDHLLNLLKKKKLHISCHAVAFWTCRINSRKRRRTPLCMSSVNTMGETWVPEPTFSTFKLYTSGKPVVQFKQYCKQLMWFLTSCNTLFIILCSALFVWPLHVFLFTGCYCGNVQVRDNGSQDFFVRSNISNLNSGFHTILFLRSAL